MSGEGVVLDADLAALVPKGSTLSYGWGKRLAPFNGDAWAGQAITHIGGRPIAELVAAHDLAMATAAALEDDGWTRREVPKAAATVLCGLAELLVPAAIAAAWHAQHDGEVE